jgi:hypothetical protein
MNSHTTLTQQSIKQIDFDVNLYEQPLKALSLFGLMPI